MTSTEPSPVSIDELFSQDPNTQTDEDIDKIVQFLRDKREVWEQEVRTATAKGKRPNPNVLGKPVSLDDLGL